MQKLSVKLKNTPGNATQVPCSVNYQLNKEETLSVDSKVRTDNNLDGYQRYAKNQGLQPKVFVLSIDDKPLMPTKPSRARKMLESGKAKVLKRSPFTIQLTFDCEEKTQDVTLGIDTGFGNIGFSAVSNDKELISGTLILDSRTKDRLDEKRMYRRNRRSRLWYRKPRFNNRSKKIGCLPPSVQRRYDTHLNIINRIKNLLPISKTIIEIAKFDIQKINNPDITGKEYQQGSLYNYQNMRSFLMSREKGKCEHCGKDFINKPSHIHHRVQRSKGGSDRPENLILVHKKCHDKIHSNNNLLKKYQKKSTKSYKHSTFMSIINKKFYNDIDDLEVTYGNITFVDRNNLGLEKTHYNDAFVIANGSNQERTKPFEIIQKHINNRVLQVNRKGYKPSIKRGKSKILPLDLFWVKGKQYSCKGMFTYGKYVCYGKVKLKEYLKFSDVEKIYHNGSLVWTIMKGNN